MPGSELDHDRPIAEYIVVLALQHDRFAFGESGEKVGIWNRAQSRLVRRPGREDRIVVALLDDPCRAGKRIGVGYMVAVIMRQRQISDVGRSVADRGQLGQQWPIHGKRPLCLRRHAGREGAVRDLARVPHHGSLRVHDEEARSHHVGGRQFARLESHRVAVRDVIFPQSRTYSRSDFGGAGFVV